MSTALNLSELADITPYSVNTSMFEDNTQLVDSFATITNDTTSGWFLFGVLIILWIFMFVVSTDRFGLFRLDFYQAGLFSSGFCLILAGFGFILGFTNSYNDVSIFATLFFLFWIGHYLSKPN